MRRPFCATSDQIGISKFTVQEVRVDESPCVVASCVQPFLPAVPFDDRQKAKSSINGL